MRHWYLKIIILQYIIILTIRLYTGYFTTCGHYCRRWFPRSWSKKVYINVSDFGWLQSYGHFLIPVHALMWTAFGISWRVTYWTRWLIVCVASNIIATWLTHPATDSPVSVSRHLESSVRAHMRAVLKNTVTETWPKSNIHIVLDHTYGWATMNDFRIQIWTILRLHNICYLRIALTPQNEMHGDHTTGNESHTDNKLTNCGEYGPSGTVCT
jgi:hypothetical protein